jgi:hypothetical protein
MSIDQIKAELHLVIEEGDAKLIRLVHAVVQAYAVSDETDEDSTIAILPPHGQKLTMEELRMELVEAEQEIEQGHFLSIDDLKKAKDKWL